MLEIVSLETTVTCVQWQSQSPHLQLSKKTFLIHVISGRDRCARCVSWCCALGLPANPGGTCVSGFFFQTTFLSPRPTQPLCHVILWFLSLRCDRLNLTALAYLWRRNQEELLDEMIKCGVNAILIKVAALGMFTANRIWHEHVCERFTKQNGARLAFSGLDPDKHLKKSLTDIQPHMLKMVRKSNSVFPVLKLCLRILLSFDLLVQCVTLPLFDWLLEKQVWTERLRRGRRVWNIHPGLPHVQEENCCVSGLRVSDFRLSFLLLYCSP